MGSFDVTYWMAFAHVGLTALAFALTARPLISTFHWFLLTSFLAFGIRPALAASVGGFTNYDSGIGWYAYNYGLLYQLLFVLCVSIAYILLSYRYSSRQPRPLLRVVRPRGFYVLLATGLVGIAALHVLSGGGWLPGARTGTINSVVPGGKYIFPIAVMSFSLLIPFGVIGYMKKAGYPWWLVLLTSLLSLSALSLLFMRGMVIAGVLLIFWAAEKEGKLRVKHLLIGLLVLFTIGQMLRPLGKFVAARYLMGESDARFAIASALAERMSPLDKVRALFLYTTNLDLADSWPVVINYVDDNDRLGGRSFLAVPARFASTKFRLDSGFLTGSDIVNDYFYGANYYDLSFGFNVTFANELFLNFGPLGLILGIVPGFLLFLADRWMRRMRAISPSDVFIAYICFRGFTSELALTLQWAVGAITLAVVVEVLAKLRLGSLRRQIPRLKATLEQGP